MSSLHCHSGNQNFATWPLRTPESQTIAESLGGVFHGLSAGLLGKKDGARLFSIYPKDQQNNVLKAAGTDAFEGSGGRKT